MEQATTQQENQINQDDIPKPEPVKTSYFGKPHVLEWFMMFTLTLMWTLGTHYTFILSNQMFPFFSKDLMGKNQIEVWKLIIFKILSFSLFAYFFEVTVVTFVVQLFVNNFFLTPDTTIHFLSASLGITLGLFSGLKLKTIIQ
jgi:hypothetical protein